MDTILLNTSREDAAKAGRIIRKGGLVAFPTETVYGLGASAYDENAADKIYAAKGRPSDNPLIVHISDPSMIDMIAKDISPLAKKAIDAFMPGPITVILNKKDSVPDVVTAKLPTVAVRCPSNECARAFIKASGVPIAAPSANLSGKPSPTKAAHVINDMMGRIDAIINGGDCNIGVESTIVDFSSEKPIILRPGGITYDDLKNAGIDAEIDDALLKTLKADETPKCPGMKYKHYAPDAQVTVVEGERDKVRKKIKELIALSGDKTVCVLTMYGAEYDNATMLQAGNNSAEYAKNLFSALRTFDALEADVVFAEFKETDGMGLAVKNRLYKAAAGRVIHV